MNLTTEQASDFAREWYEAWNSHQLERVLSHYTDDVVFTSPFVVHGDESGTLWGKDALRKHVRRGLERIPDLRFEPIETLTSSSSVVLYYRGVLNLLVAELMELNAAGKVARGIAHYNELPRTPDEELTASRG